MTKEVTLADVMAAMIAQAKKMEGKLDTQYAEMQGSFACVKEEVAGCVDRVLKEAKAHVDAECLRVKSEVFSEVYTKVEVETEVCDLKKYVDSAIAGHATLFLRQDRGSQFRCSGQGSGPGQGALGNP